VSAVEAVLTKCPKTLFAKGRECCRDAVEDTFDADVDHLVPIIDAEVVEGRPAR
jgi:hypothetical protein